jgi:predicted nucleic acid-binding protein
MYLLDTNVVSELRRLKPHGGLLAWLRQIADRDLHLSAVSVGEIQEGVELTRDQDVKQASEIETWLQEVIDTYNVLPMDAVTFRVWAKLMHRRSETLLDDGMIAATALVHGLTVVTRNTRDFKVFSVPTVNPFEFGR